MSINKPTPLQFRTFYVSKFEKEIPEILLIDQLAGRHYPYMNDSKLDNAIPERQQIEVLSFRHCPYLKVLQPEYAIPEHQQINHHSRGQHSFLSVS